MTEKVKTVLVLYVGGTIGMKKNENDVYVPAPDVFIDELKSDPKLHNPDLAAKNFPNIKDTQLVLPKIKNDIILYEVKEYEELLDSSNMTSEDWIKIANDIEENYNSFDGFVVLHGTDTLTYTSSALSFMTEHLQKTVIVTGAQISIFEPRSDASNNILLSLILAGSYRIPEICVFFGNKLLRGNRTTKIRLSQFDAFDSPNYDLLALEEVDLTLNSDRILEPATGDFTVNTNLNAKVAILTFFPTITPSLIEHFFEQPLDGVVIQTYGTGNIPSNQTQIVQVLKDAVDRGVLIVNVSMCLQGSVSGIYDTGKVLEDIGVVPGYDMTAEAALTKLSVVLGFSELAYQDKVQLMKENTRGELTNPETKKKNHYDYKKI